MSDLNKRYGAHLDGHDVELQFDKKLVVLNRARLSVDGELVDKENIVYGEAELHTTLPDGTEIVVKLGSGFLGEIMRPQLRRPDGSWVDLEERAAT